MKLAEALAYRKELEGDISRIQASITENMSYLEEDGPPDFDMDKAFVELEDKQVELGLLIYRINRTNNQTMLGNGLTVMEAIVLRDSLGKSIQTYTSIRAMAAYSIRSRTREDELKSVSNINKEEIDETLRELQADQKRVDLDLQEGNWKYDLVEFESLNLESALLGGFQDR